MLELILRIINSFTFHYKSYFLILVFFFLFNNIVYLIYKKYYNFFLNSLFILMSMFFIISCKDFFYYAVIYKLIFLSFFYHFLYLFIHLLSRKLNFDSDFESILAASLVVFIAFLEGLKDSFDVLRIKALIGIFIFFIIRFLYLYYEKKINEFIYTRFQNHLYLFSCYVFKILVYIFNLLLLVYFSSYINLVTVYYNFYSVCIQICTLLFGILFMPYAFYILEKIAIKLVYNINLANVDRIKTLTGFFQIIFKIIYIVTLFCSIFGLKWFGNMFTTFAFLAFAFQDFFKSLINGLLVLFEDSVNIGEFVEIAGVSGKVEEISLRIIKLRDFEGSLFIVPFHKIDVIRNRGKDYVYVLFKISVLPKIDANIVVTSMKEAFEKIKNNEEYEHLKNNFLENIEIIGVTSISSAGMIFEARLKIRPYNTRLIKAAYYKELKTLFDANKIEFGYEYWLVARKGKVTLKH